MTNDRAPTVKRASIPVVQCIDGRWCWLVFGSNPPRYQHEPALERALLAAMAVTMVKKAA